MAHRTLLKRHGRSRHIGFRELSRRITKEYEKKGISAKKAKLWGKKTAGKVARVIRRKRKVMKH